MDKSELKEQFDTYFSKHERLKDNLEEALKVYLNEQGIPYLGVYGRVKSFESFYEKIKRKSYTNPFHQTEDFVGLRVILYFPSHIKDVFNLINDKFEVVQSEDKSDNLDVNEFGYRSHHCIITIDPDWCKTPNYDGLRNIKSEVQIRTVLMHSWAEIEHKLQYKNKKQVPRELQRKLFLLSAKLEEADQQFEDIKDEANRYQKVLSDKLRMEGKFDTDLELNLDTYKQFLLFFYPESNHHELMTKDQFDLLIKNNMTYSDLVDIAVKFQPFEKSLKSKVHPLARAAVFSYVLDTIVPQITEQFNYSISRLKLIRELQEEYGKA
jgi:putative GTP pyrophosphokinase